MAKFGGQKFIGRNRAPRVQIEYDVEVYGAEKKVELPFVMGVLADLSGKPAESLSAVADRKALEIDVDNFDERLKSTKPRVAFKVPNTLTGKGNLSVDLTFESMDDFSPAAVARKVDGLRQLLEARTQLANLLTYMDGKSGAEDLIGRVLQDPTLLQSLVSGANPNASPAPAPAQPAPPKPADSEPPKSAATAPAPEPAPQPPAPESTPTAVAEETTDSESDDSSLDDLLTSLGSDDDDED